MAHKVKKQTNKNNNNKQTNKKPPETELPVGMSPTLSKLFHAMRKGRASNYKKKQQQQTTEILIF
jgi:hypothetical protein